MTPFIHLFRSPNKYYFYDVNKDCVVSINDRLYSFLDEKKEIPEDIWTIKELDQSDIATLESLRGEGYLKANLLEEIHHPLSSNLEFQLENRMNHLVLQVTQACNLVCSYCPYANKTDGDYQRNHTGKMMDWKTAKKSVDFFVDHSTEINTVTISFYGGEPFLNFPLIQKVVTYANKQFVGKWVKFSLTTNGTLLNDEIIHYLHQNDFGLIFSIDGPASIHDQNRKKADGNGSYNEAVSNLKKLCALYGDQSYNKIWINTVVNTETDFDEILKLFDDPFFREKKVKSMASLVNSGMLEKPIEYRNDFKQKFNYNRFVALMDQFDLSESMDLDPISEWFVNVQLDSIQWNDTKSNDLGPVTAPSGPCVPGQRRLFVNVDGNMFPCERVNELSEDMKMGSIQEGIDYKKADKLLNIAELTKDQCKNCYAFRHCNVCARHVTKSNEISAKQKLTQCSKVKNNFNSNLKLIALKQEINSIYKGNTP